MNKAFVEKYFERVGLIYREDEKTDEVLLKKLQYAHVTHIPYETVYITEGKPLSLEKDVLFDKIVTRKRGGFCFELNGLFSFLLKELGYDVADYFARFLRGEKEIPIRRHRVAVVSIGDERWLCDVGVGSASPRYPLLLEENIIQEQCGEAYRFSTDPFLGWVIKERNPDDSWSDYYSFTEEKQLNKDFIPTMFFCEKHTDSPFKNLMISLKTDKGRITVDGNIFKITEYGNAVCRKELTETELKSCMREYFML